MGKTRAFVASLAALLVSLVAIGTASAAAPSKVIVVPPGGSSCGFGGPTYPTINDAVAAVAPGGTVQVCAGTYHEDVVVTKPVLLEGFNATVEPDATDTSPLADQVGGNNAFTVLAPNVWIRGFTVQHATGDGILVVGDHAVIQANHAVENGINGINLDGSSWSVVRGNTLTANNSGIELANDPIAGGIPPQVLAQFGSTGTATHDVVEANQVVENPAACGILLVDHAGAATSLGIHDNVIRGNVVKNNALAGFGAGILLASPVPNGAVYRNIISNNTISGNGLSGVTLHSHLPGQYFAENSITNNLIGTNNLRGADQEPDDPQTTGIFIGSQTPLTITISGNTITDNHFGIFTAGPVTIVGLWSNRFLNDAVSFASKPTFEQ